MKSQRYRFARVISCRSCSMRSILLSRVNESTTGIGIIFPAQKRESVKIADRCRSSSRYESITKCVTASNSHRRFRLIYISAFDSRAYLRAARKITSGTSARAADIFNPLAFTGELYGPRGCTLNAVILIGSRTRYFPLPASFKLYVTFSSRIYKLRAIWTLDSDKKSLRVSRT